MSEVAQKTDGRFSFTSPVRMFFGNLFEPRPVGKRGKARGTPKYSVTLGIPVDHPDLTAMKAKAVAVAKARFPGRDLKTLKFPFEDGAKRAAKSAKDGRDGSFFEGHVLLTARSKYPPQVSVLEGGKIVEYANERRGLAASKFYNGCMVVAQVNFASYEGQQDEETGAGNPDGVNAYVDIVLKTGEGTRIGGASAAEVFKSYVGGITAEDPTGGTGVDDEIPF
jgi:hypothetical protein